MNKITSGWYVIYTKPKQEYIAEMNLKQQAFDVYFPLAQRFKHNGKLYKKISEPLFSRYLFIYLNLASDNWNKIRSTRGCMSLLNFAGKPARVPDKLINELKKAIEQQDSQLIQKIPTFSPGDKVEIIEGALTGYHGIVKVHDRKERVILLLNIAENYTHGIEVPVHHIQHFN